MADDKTNRGARDRSRINLSQEYERRDWARSLGVTEAELKEAVHAVGDSAEQVRAYLNKRSSRA